MKTNKHHHLTSHLGIRGLCLGLMLVGSLFVAYRASADDLQPLIDAVTKQIQTNQAEANQKQAEGDTLQNKLSILQDHLDAGRANLQLTRLKIDKSEQDLQANKEQLETQTELLRENIAAVYRQGGLSPMELVASSNTLSDLVSKQQYYTSLRGKVTQNVESIRDAKKAIEDLQNKLLGQENEVKLELKAVGDQEAEMAALVAETRGQEKVYRELVAADNTRLSTLRAQQSAVIAAQSAGRDYSITSEYPWAGAEPFPNSGVDPWGFYYRQCTSYAAWRRANLGRPIPAWGFLGPANAKQWPDWARQYQMRVDSVPEVGALGVYPVGEYGHVMVVESVLKNGQQVLVSEFNANWDGRYSQSLWPTSALVFIH
jgi:surface antigen